MIENGEINKIQTTFFDLDINKQVTYSRYIDWCMDRFSIDFHSKNYPKKISINYLKETKPKEEIKISKNKIDENTYHFEGFNISSQKQAFRCEIDF